MQVRASDVRVSERVCMSSITLERYATVYNDLTEEVCSRLKMTGIFRIDSVMFSLYWTTSKTCLLGLILIGNMPNCLNFSTIIVSNTVIEYQYD